MQGPSNKLFDVFATEKNGRTSERRSPGSYLLGSSGRSHTQNGLANPVMVRKKNMSWSMCVDYTDLNKACPKDLFPLPRIDQTIDSTAGCERLCFLDAYSGYHQICMKESDLEKTSFIMPMAHSVASQCPSDSKTLEQHINERCRSASMTKLE